MTKSELNIYTFIDDDLLMDICDTKKELGEESNVHFLHVANSNKSVPFYSLYTIISIGCRVKYADAIVFRNLQILS